MTGPGKPARKGGLARVLAAAGHSLSGLRRLLQEKAARQELALIAGLALTLIARGASLTAILGLMGLGLALLAVEALNTAIEELVDHLSPEWSTWAKHAKDLGSFAVASVIVTVLLYALAVLFL